MKTLGIIGGITPHSTVDYYRQLTAGYRAKSPDGSYPSLLISSIDATRFLPLVTGGNRPALADFLLAEVGRLARGGADVGLFASNTPHIVFDDVAARSPIPLISIVEQTATAAAARRFTTVGLIGAGITMDADIYPTVFGRRGITVVIPDADDRAYVNDRYFAELAEGSLRDETQTGISSIVDAMTAKDNIDAVILGGTELPLLFRNSGLPHVPILDTTLIHVESAIEWLLA